MTEDSLQNSAVGLTAQPCKITNVIQLLRHFAEFGLLDRLGANPMSSALCSPEKEKVTDTLIQHYHPVINMRTFHRFHARVVISLQQGFEGERAQCFYCKQVDHIKNLSLNHKNYKKHDNRLVNFNIAHNNCNSKHVAQQRFVEQQAGYAQHRESDSIGQRVSRPNDMPIQGQRERENPTNPQAGGSTGAQVYSDELATWSAREGQKSEEMRYRFNLYIHGEDGISKELRSKNWAIRMSVLANKCVYGCSPEPSEPFGAAQTYMKMIHTDADNGIFEKWKEGGVWFVRYLGKKKDPASLK